MKSSKSTEKKKKKRSKLQSLEEPNFDTSAETVNDDLAKHAAVFAVWAVRVARLEAYIEAKEAQLEEIVAPLRRTQRDLIAARLGRSAVTERAVADAVIDNTKVRRYRVAIRKARSMYLHSKAVLAALDVKTRTLQSLAGLVRSEMGALGGSY